MPEEDLEMPAPDAADARVQEAATLDATERAARAIRQTIEAMPLHDRMLLRFHFGAELSIADAARMMGVEQRPLYRRIDTLLRQLREALEGEGLDASAIADLISAGGAEMFDFGLGNGKSALSSHTPSVEEP